MEAATQAPVTPVSEFVAIHLSSSWEISNRLLRRAAYPALVASRTLSFGMAFCATLGLPPAICAAVCCGCIHLVYISGRFPSTKSALLSVVLLNVQTVICLFYGMHMTQLFCLLTTYPHIHISQQEFRLLCVSLALAVYLPCH